MITVAATGTCFDWVLFVLPTNMDLLPSNLLPTYVELFVCI